MKTAATFLAAASAFALAACGSGERSEGEDVQAVYDDQAETLEEAADVSAPGAQPVLENAADDLRERGENAQEAIDEGEEGETGQ